MATAARQIMAAIHSGISSERPSETFSSLQQRILLPSFGFLGFDFRGIRSRRGVWGAYYTPKLKKRTALLRKLKTVSRRYQSQPVDRVVRLINPILSGWVNYFAIGDSGECFAFVED